MAGALLVAFAVLSPTLLAAEAGSQAADGLEQHGIAYAESGRSAEARQAFQKLVAPRPGDGDALTLLGLAEFRERRYDDALKHLESARTLMFRTEGCTGLLEYHSALILILRADCPARLKVFGC